MSGDAVEEVRRARPLSGGLWTLFSWLRRDERSSSESLSSAGSDRTAASFAFLAPPSPRARTHSHPLPPASPTDSYKKRVRDRNQRRQHDRDLTLHRKYGLFRGDVGYDAFSLPFARKSLGAPERESRERRATSECFQRPAAHVPGKRRAPPPPAPPTSLTQRHTRKRPAPQPPVISYRPKQNNNHHQSIEPQIVVKMYSKSDYDKRPLASSDVALGCRSEKYSKKDGSKNTKTGTEKSFLKQIFENRKRNSVIETPPNKILPSISELDKQAAEIIESYKLRAMERNNNVTSDDTASKGESWFCTLCLRKYSSTVGSCMYCLPEPKLKTNGLVKDSYKNIPVSSNNNCTQTENKSILNVASTSRVSGVNVDEKQKLKEMLKEMKDSLPKRPKHNKSEISNSKNTNVPVVKSNEERAIETPTLRIGSTLFQEEKTLPVAESSPNATREKSQIKNADTSNNVRISNSIKLNPVTETVVITHHVVLMGASPVDNLRLNRQSSTYNNSMHRTSEPVKGIINKGTSNAQTSKVVDPKETNINKSSDLIFNSDNNKANLYIPPKTNSSILTESGSGTNNNKTPDFFNIRDTQKGILQPLMKNDSSNVTQQGNGVNNNKFIDSSNSHNETGNIHMPLKISSLLNPVYIPKSNVPEGHIRRNFFFSPITNPASHTEIEEQKTSSKKSAGITQTSHSDLTKASTQVKSDEHQKRLTETQASSSKEPTPLNKSIVKEDIPKRLSPVEQKTIKTLLAPVPTISNITAPDKHKLSDSNIVRLSAEQHSRRRNLINQLEQSIAKGDERAAADAAVQLAQLRLACSVLSFSSQITHDAVKVTPIPIPEQNAVINNETKLKASTTSKVSTGVQSTASISPKDKNNKKPVNTEDNTISTEKEIKENQSPSTALKSEPLEHKPLSQLLKSSTASTSAAKPSGSKLSNENGTNLTSIEVWVEDREATRGPVQLRIPRQAVMAELRRRAEASLGLAARLQRWIVGHTLCTDDNMPLVSLAGPDLKAPFYLCVVESESKPKVPTQARAEDTERHEPRPTDTQDGKVGDVYSELVLLERRALVPNAEPFECGVCMEECAVGRGAVLRECMHTFCTDCLASLVRLCEEPAASCPAMGCPGTLQEREIRAVVSPEEYERWLARGLATAESGTRNAFHCRTRDCTGWALCDPGVRRFPCPVCKGINCVPCQAIHEGETCEQHKAKLKETANPDANHTDEGTRALLDTLITKGEALQCPECSAIITKKWGCDWVKCSACKTEICWVTRGRRWGPAGRGDTSAGCRCGVDGKRCHPSCGYCH